MQSNKNIRDYVVTPLREFWEFRTISLIDENNELQKLYLKKELELELEQNQSLKNKKTKI